MNDDLEAAEAGLEKGTSAFHKLGRGMITFMRATLGFEQEVMREAADRLADAESQASSDHRRAQKEPQAFHSEIYGLGSEFALCYAMSQLMSAVVGILNENLVESVKSVYKLRKAYTTLDGILQAESRYMQKHQQRGGPTARRESLGSLKSAQSDKTSRRKEHYGESPPHTRPIYIFQEDGNLERDDLRSGSQAAFASAGAGEVLSAAESSLDLKVLPRQFDGEIERTTTDVVPTEINGQQAGLPEGRTSENLLPKTPTRRSDLIEHDPDSGMFQHPMDIFVHSGANLCFGLLLLLISSIPPAFGKLLYIVGFKGDRVRGIRMLWQASKFHNINGAMAGLIVMGYYNAFVAYCDILPDTPADSTNDDDQIDGYPLARMEVLLAEMRKRYPQSRLWLLEESRMQAARRKLDVSLSMLNSKNTSSLKQVEGLTMFEKASQAMFAHRYQLCSESFRSCVSLNNWSHCLYVYIAAISHVELYRGAKRAQDEATAAREAERAEDLLLESRSYAGRKRFMARQLPLDAFISRKIAKWETRATDWRVPLIEAVGVSPIEEMNYFWNGIKRMDAAQLEISLLNLSWSDNLTCNPHWTRETLDECAILAVLRAAIFRCQQKHTAAMELLKTVILVHDTGLFKGGLKDDWTPATAHYEMGVNLWNQRDDARAEHITDERKARVREALEWVEKAAKWEGYQLDARIGLKITSGLETLRKWRAGHDP